MLAGNPDLPALTSELERAGLWDVCADGWMVHDWLKYNQPADKVAQRREAARLRMADKRKQENKPEEFKGSSQERSREHAQEIPAPLLSSPILNPTDSNSPLPPQAGESARLSESPTSEQTAGWVKVIAAQGKPEQPTEPPPPQGLPGIPAQTSEPEKAPKSNRKRDRDKGAWDRATLTATPLLAELSQARMRVRSGLRPIKPLPSTLEHITARLVEGYTADDIRHVIRVCEEESRHSADSFKYFDAVTPFLPANFARKVARAIEDAGRQSRPAQVFRAGPPTPEETARINEARRRADEAQTADAKEAARRRRELVVDEKLEQSRADFLKIAFATMGDGATGMGEGEGTCT
jgi:hypothetical protein